MIMCTDSEGWSLVIVGIAKLLTYGYMLCLHRFEHVHNRTSSTSCLLFWLLNLIVALIKLRTAVELSPKTVSWFIGEAVGSLLVFILELIPKGKLEYQALDQDDHESPEQSANIFSSVLFIWLDPMMKLGHSKALEIEDLWSLSESMTAAYNSAIFQRNIKTELANEHPWLFKTLVVSFGREFMLAGVFELVAVTSTMAKPLLLEMMMQFSRSYESESEIKPQPYTYGFVYAFGIFGVSAVSSICMQHYFYEILKMGVRVRAAITAAVYEKALKLSSKARQTSTVGEITNYMSVDADRIANFFLDAHWLWGTPLQIVLVVFFLYNTLGLAVLGGIAVMVVMVPINWFVASRAAVFQEEQMNNKDSRTKLMDEILAGMKIIKLYAWEIPFKKKVLSVREKELYTLKKMAYLESAISFTWTCTPFLFALSTIATYSLTSSEPLTSTKLFVSLSLFSLLEFPLSVLPHVIAAVVESFVSMRRLTKFFQLQERNQDSVTFELADETKDSVSIINGSFNWTEDDTMALQNINLSLSQGQLIAVIGRVGAGKSTLLSAILGHTYKKEGEVIVRGTIAYVPQSAWMINATLKENILFGEEFDEEFYHATIQACGLVPDLQSLAAGDMTEIGEFGINLSGGQKQRIAIARAVYSRADIYLFDDALSAVDAHVGKHIFDHVLGKNGLLKDKARLFVTHGIHYLRHTDQVMMLHEGKVVESGSFKQLKQQKGAMFQLVHEFGKEHMDTHEVKQGETAWVGVKLEKMESTGSLITIEEREKGSVKFSVYQTYLKSCRLIPSALFLLAVILYEGFAVCQNLLLAAWSQENDSKSDTTFTTMQWLIFYAILGISSSLFGALQAIFGWVICGIRASKVLHEGLLDTMMKLPQSFFDTTPLGRIINRFSKDMYTIDEPLPFVIMDYFRTLLHVIAVLFINTIGNPLYILLILPLSFLYRQYQHYYLNTSRELKRIESTTKSPIYSHFQESLNGVATIDAYNHQERFKLMNQTKVDVNQKSMYIIYAANRWLGIRLELIGALVVLLSGVLGVYGVAITHSVTSSVLGLMLVYSISVTQSLNWMVRNSCEVENNIVAVERIKEYTDMPSEAPHEIPETDPGQDWPCEGRITFKNYSTKYRPELECVVNNLDFEIRPKEKIGIVGRTGAGKSSLTLALFRIIEPVTGTIMIDSVDISLVGLHTLRSRISIIPQDPVLFCGSVRYNLDPFDEHSDFEVWDALEKAHLKVLVSSFENGLMYEVSQGGANFSVGQRQLICLARAVIRKAKILVLDEATAAIDVETDAIIQETIRSEMKDCTILTIAHRINTIMDSDRILVLDKGRISEFDTPANLLANKQSMFHSLAKQSGLHK
ncbi:hypothetical protein HDV06_000427 [Boothiomyces sp. JEL0866]|nr:hypothetical protein HDV06_000427 [Boothiomyces sp. JEL0866]